MPLWGKIQRALTSDEECTALLPRPLPCGNQRHFRNGILGHPVSPFLESVKGTDEYKEALQIPHRARTGRIVEKPQGGVILFGKKGEDFVFKISDGDHEPIMLSAEEALQLFEAAPEENRLPPPRASTDCINE